MLKSSGRKRLVSPSLLLIAMRTFVIVGHKATVSPNFSLEDIPGTSGRLDILCRCINAAFVISHGIRRDTIVYLVLLGGNPPKTICLKGEVLRHLNPDERTTAALLKKALALAAGPRWTASTSGIFVRTGGLAEVIEDMAAMRLIYLREDGAEIGGIDNSANVAPGDAAFVLGDHQGMTCEEEAMLEQAGAMVVSVGSTSLHADHCIVVINWLLDTGRLRL